MRRGELSATNAQPPTTGLRLRPAPVPIEETSKGEDLAEGHARQGEYGEREIFYGH
jgi:hypothetical protein